MGRPWAPHNQLRSRRHTHARGSEHPIRFVQCAPGTTSAWRYEILRAFQTWAVNANINIALSPMGTGTGYGRGCQGDARFGDIRIGAAALSPDLVAFAAPFSWTGTTFGGDMVFNNTQPFGIGAHSTAFDVFSVALHEAGHVFGLDHHDGDSVMNAGYAFSTGLSADDIAELRSLYGVRSADPFDARRSNDTPTRATLLNGQRIGSGRRSIATANLTDMHDVDFYKFTTTSNSATVRLQAQGLSLLELG